MKFFQLIPAGTNFKFVENNRRYLVFSLVAMLLAFGAMAYNTATTGTPLNFGIDFRGGTSVRLELSKEVDVTDLRDSLVQRGHQGASAVAVPDADNQILVKVKESVSIDDETLANCRAAAEKVAGKSFGEHGFHHPEESSKIFLRFPEEPPALAKLQSAMNEAGCAGRAERGEDKEGRFEVDYSLVGVGAQIQAQIDEAFGAGTVSRVVASETVGPRVGEQLKVKGVESLLYAMAGIFVYVLLRFDLRFAPGGIVALLHDAIFVTGIYAITGREFSLQSVAAILTVVGYSINDTIVVFDRVRERTALERDRPIRETTNSALNDTLSRTVLTSGTTLIVLISILVLGVGSIQDFAFALAIGVLIGTYSTLFVASPVFLWVNDRFFGGEGHLSGIDEEEGTGTLLGGAKDQGQSFPDPGSSTTPPGQDPSGGGGEKKASRRRRRRS